MTTVTTITITTILSSNGKYTAHKMNNKHEQETITNKSTLISTINKKQQQSTINSKKQQQSTINNKKQQQSKINNINQQKATTINRTTNKQG